MDETAGSTAAPAARCRKILRGSFIGVLLPDRFYCTRVNGRGPAMRAWIDRTNDGLEWDARRRHQPATKKGDFGTSRWARLEGWPPSPTRLGARGLTSCGPIPSIHGHAALRSLSERSGH